MRLHETTSRRPDASTVAACALVVLVVGFLIALATVRPSLQRLWGDEGTFVAMTASLVEDGDLAFDELDLDRLQKGRSGSSATLILQQTELGITYSKPALYPLLATPFFAVAGEPGLVALNYLALAGALSLAWCYLAARGSSRLVAWTLLTFLLCSVLPAYLGWKMSDLLQTAMVLAGLALILGPIGIESGKRPFSPAWAAVCGGLLLGASVTMRFTAAALLAAALLALLSHRHWRRGVVVAIAAASAFLAISGLSQGLQGTANPYKAVRSSFNAEIGYPAGPDASDALQRFTSRPATQSATWRPAWQARQTAYSTLYFFVGRHTGLLLYFPVALVLILHSLRRPDRLGLSMIAGVVAISGFYLIWMPGNYFGGSTFIGNRYFLGAFPALLVALRRLPNPRWLAVAWLVAIPTWASAYYSASLVRDIDDSSQSHTRAGLFRALPFESTAQKIDGVVDRFWSSDFVRFVDPFADPARWSFELDSSRRAAEIQVVTDWPGQSLIMVVAASRPDSLLEVCDRGGCQEFVLPQQEPHLPGVIEIDPASAWRRHPYWWKPNRVFTTRSLRLGLGSPDAEPVSAVVRYLGRRRGLVQLDAQLTRLEIPDEVIAGSRLETTIGIRNQGKTAWETETILPIRIGLRLAERSTGKTVGRDRIALQGKVQPGVTTELPLTIDWPTQPGEYELRILLFREPAAQLGDAGRLELERRVIEVQSK